MLLARPPCLRFVYSTLSAAAKPSQCLAYTSCTWGAAEGALQASHRLTGRHRQQQPRRRVSSFSTATAQSAAAPGLSSTWDVSQAGIRKEDQRDDLHVVLVHPQIPQNAGSAARTCAATSVALHLVGPLGFQLDDRKLKRAGLDYWEFVVVHVHESWEEFNAFFEEVRQRKGGRLIAYSKFGSRHHATQGTYLPGDWLLFGAETTGLPEQAHAATLASGGHVVRIPMVERHVRSINLAVSVGVGVFEALRQLDGPHEIAAGSAVP